MPQAIITPEDVKRFSSDLQRFNSTLKSDYSRIHSKLKQLGQTWRDQEHKKFEKEFDQTAKAIKQFLSSSEKYVPFLQRKAKAADDYLKQR